MEDDQLSDPILGAILKQLQKSLRSILQESEEWQKSQAQGAKRLDSIVNMAETLQCCSRVTVSHTPLATFPDIKERLLHKIDRSIDNEMQHIRNSLETLRKTQEKINISYTKTMAFYRKSGSECTMEQLSKGAPTRVSIATMLEWISDLNQLFYELLVTQEHLLENLDYTSSDCMEHFQKQWPKYDSLRDKLSGKILTMSSRNRRKYETARLLLGNEPRDGGVDKLTVK